MNYCNNSKSPILFFQTLSLIYREHLFVFELLSSRALVEKSCPGHWTSPRRHNVLETFAKTCWKYSVSVYLCTPHGLPGHFFSSFRVIENNPAEPRRRVGSINCTTPSPARVPVIAINNSGIRQKIIYIYVYTYKTDEGDDFFRKSQRSPAPAVAHAALFVSARYFHYPSSMSLACRGDTAGYYLLIHSAVNTIIRVFFDFRYKTITSCTLYTGCYFF